VAVHDLVEAEVGQIPPGHRPLPGRLVALDPDPLPPLAA
jgi:hypothetical protein